MDNENFKSFGIGGSRLVKGQALCEVHTFQDGDRRLAVLHTNPDNEITRDMQPDYFCKAAVDKIKEEKGWDYATYQLVCGYRKDDTYERVNWNKNPISGEPTFGAANTPIPRQNMASLISSFTENILKDELNARPLPVDRTGAPNLAKASLDGVAKTHVEEARNEIANTNRPPL